jgi:hypothetical protein
MEDFEFMPEPEDYVISDTGPLGTLYSVGIIEGKHVGVFPTLQAAIAAISEDMEDSQFWPNVWIEDDHGGMRLAEQ